MSTLLKKTMREEGGCASDLRLDRLLLGELPATDAHALREHVAGCEHCGPRLAALEAGRAAFAPEAEAWKTPSLGRSRASRRWALPGGLALGALAASLSLLVVRPALQEDDGLRSKGGARVGLYVQHGGVLRLGGTTERVAAGDTLQFVTSLRTARHVAVLSVDGSRRASVFYPAGPYTAEQPAGEDLPLPLSTVLDAAPGPERVHVLLCEAPLELSPLLRALEAQPTHTPAPAGCEVQSFLLSKESP